MLCRTLFRDADRLTFGVCPIDISCAAIVLHCADICIHILSKNKQKKKKKQASGKALFLSRFFFIHFPLYVCRVWSHYHACCFVCPFNTKPLTSACNLFNLMLIYFLREQPEKYVQTTFLGRNFSIQVFSLSELNSDVNWAKAYFWFIALSGSYATYVHVHNKRRKGPVHTAYLKLYMASVQL